jgi:hypothetical protein
MVVLFIHSSHLKTKKDAGTTPKDEAGIEAAGGAAASLDQARQLLIPPLALQWLLPRKRGGACSCA